VVRRCAVDPGPCDGGNPSTVHGGGFVGADGLATLTNSTIRGHETRQRCGLAVVDAFGGTTGPSVEAAALTLEWPVPFPSAPSTT